MYNSLHVLVTVTIIRQTFQYMDMTCSVLQYSIPYCLHLLCRISDMSEILHSKCKQYGIPYCGTEHVMSMYLNVCLMMVTCNRNTYQLYIIYIVVF